MEETNNREEESQTMNFPRDYGLLLLFSSFLPW